MTKRNLILSGLALMLPLALAMVVVLHPTRAKSEDKASPLEVRVDNFTFGPDALTVPVNSTVTWVNKDDLPHVIASTDGVFKSKASIRMTSIHTRLPRQALTPTSAVFIRRWWERSLFSS